MESDSITDFVKVVHAAHRDAVADFDRAFVVRVVALIDNFLVVGDLIAVVSLRRLLFLLEGLQVGVVVRRVQTVPLRVF